jgi:hypothetical protein
VENEMLENLDQLKEQYPDLVAEVLAPIEKQLEDMKKAKEQAEFKLVEKELAEYKETEIAKLEINDKVKTILRSKVNGKTKEEITKSLKTEIENAKAYEEAFKVEKEEAKIDGVPESKDDKDKVTIWTSKAIRDSKLIPDDLKVECIRRLIEEGSDNMKKYLEANKVKL